MNATSEQGGLKERSVYVGLANHVSEGVQAVGLLKLVQHGVMQSGEFAYGRRYLGDPAAQPLNPDHLQLRDAPFVLPEKRLRDGGALPLTLRDALPDSWGRKVLEMQHGPLQDLDALLLTNEDRVGAMVFSESLPIAAELPIDSYPAIDALAEASRRIEAGLDVAPAMRRLLVGGSLGGARPKATFIHAGRRCIAKFASRGDDHDVEVLEAATLGLAMSCGISTSSFFIQPLAVGHALLLERFDRTGPVQSESRFHYLSAAALLDAPYESNQGSYVELAQALRRVSSRPEQDLNDLFRRLVFNLCVGNTDDHVKNHGVLHQGHGFWRLAPAFDVVPQLNANVGVQGMAILPGRNDSSLQLAREAAPHFGLSKVAAEEVVTSIGDSVIQQAYRAVRAAGGDTRLARRMKAYVAQQADRIRA
ncbi:type II toxin-antitoxin system HipA family toxin [Variovorax sp. WS11]|uniref:type II toxin-antitoxin system HipA family toxin n=1 Tax=Variovorax sp. WS11 TaxID=1105204 RepID=UPI000D0DDC79|nr:type II toxin-antitoxin system HipA family toxin [Variovorax sp. WS11]NDZ15680.1 type II toxin-antitoxin system HipA family toxin [Variovorax sp. WS11]PSL82950.1 type II toxin-antitoxin system HipA family toxin [Variovorax sp. WS11]